MKLHERQRRHFVRGDVPEVVICMSHLRAQRALRLCATHFLEQLLYRRHDE